MPALKQSDRIRLLVAERYVQPALRAGSTRLSIRVRDVLHDVGREDFPRGRTPLICEVLQGKKLLKENGLEIESVDGPPSKQSPTVVVHYRLLPSATDRDSGAPKEAVVVETSAARAKRLTDKLRGLLKEEITAFGGSDAFMKWIRSDDDDENAA